MWKARHEGSTDRGLHNAIIRELEVAQRPPHIGTLLALFSVHNSHHFAMSIPSFLHSHSPVPKIQCLTCAARPWQLVIGCASHDSRGIAPADAA